MTKQIASIALLAFIAGCNSSADERVSVASSALESSQASSDIYPVPVLHKSVAPYADEVDPTTNLPRVAWDGSHGELLIADAYAECIGEMGGRIDSMYRAPDSAYPYEGTYSTNGYGLDNILMKMRAAACPVQSLWSVYTHEIHYAPGAIAWAVQRTDPSCNMNPATGEHVAALEMPPTDENSPAVRLRDWALSTDYDFGGDWSWTTLSGVHRDVWSAEVNLCLAQRVESILENQLGLSISDQEHALFLGLTHERAQAAMLTLADLLRLSTLPLESLGYSSKTARVWMDEDAESLDRLKSDFFRAIQLTGSSATTFATYLERQAGARWTTAKTVSPFERDWGRESARSRLLNLVYGGGALNDFWTASSWRPKWFLPIMRQNGDPQQNVLYSLAKDANALYLKFDGLGSGVANLTLGEESAKEIYRETEIWLRALACQGADTDCSHDNIAATLPTLEMESDYWLFRKYGVTLEHARSLAQGLFDAGVQYDIAGGLNRDDVANSGFYGVMHLVGQHELIERSDGSTWVRLDPRTIAAQYSFSDRAEYGHGTCSERHGTTWPSDSGENWGIGSSCHFVAGAPGPDTTQDLASMRDDYATEGVVTALAVAREVLFDLATNETLNPEQSDTASNVLTGLKALLGTTTVVQRRASIDVISDNAEMELVTPSGVLSRPSVRLAAAHAKYNGPSGISRDALDEEAGRGEDGTTLGSGPASGLISSSWKTITGQTLFNPNGRAYLLRRAIGNGSNDYVFISAQQDRFYRSPIQGDGPTIITDGWFSDLLARVTSVSDNNWSRPRFDGFGLTANWVPPADASLMGGNTGEESYQYLLRSAKGAAEEATSAVQTAIDKLVVEAQDASALSQAETKASALAGLETTSLCGTVKGCLLDDTDVSFTAAAGTAASVCMNFLASNDFREPYEACVDTMKEANERLGKAQLPKVVAEQLSRANETFSEPEYVGSELQRVLVRIWNAARLLREARDQAERLAAAAGSDRLAAITGVRTAWAEHKAALADITLLAANNALAEAEQRGTAIHQLSQAGAGVLSLCARVQKEYDPENPSLMDSDGETCGATCESNGIYWDNASGAIDCPNPEYRCLRNATLEETVNFYTDGSHYVSGASAGENDTKAAQNLRCYDAIRQYESASNTYNVALLSETQKLVYWQGNPVTQKEIQDADIIANIEATEARWKLARVQRSQQIYTSNVQTGSHLGTVTQVAGELAAALAELEQLKLKAGQAQARADLENNLAKGTYQLNASLRRKFRSYDMWRARALLESARRLAVAARRSIEARFVVDLSTMTADQAFVASPAAWADEVYESDLNAPEVVGLSRASSIAGAVYPNKLVDYVGNLERFVKGYSTTYPTSVSLPDTEVITFGGPDRIQMSGASTPSSLSTDSLGWRFYCPTTKTWIAHPGTGQYPVSNRIATACGGAPPAYAKLGFSLDAWGGLNGAWTRPRYADRHNVRWRRLAVNLVGTGIRDCSLSADAMNCYTNPFVRFNMIHSGPSWQTNYSQEWKALDLATARIESGKALAAEEWLEPITNSWSMPYVSNVARGEFFGRPAAGYYELVLEVTPDIRLDRIERIQMLVEQDYWVRQTTNTGGYEPDTESVVTIGAGGTTGAGGASSVGGGSSTGGSGGNGGSTGSSGTRTVSYSGSCTPVGSDPVIDDFEHATRVVPLHEGRLGIWFGIHAGTCSSSLPETEDSFIPQPNGSAYAGYAMGLNCTETDWSGGGIGMIFLSQYTNGVETKCAAYDASRYTGIRFQAKGTGTIRVEVATAQNIDKDFAGYEVSTGDTWADYTIRWSQLRQLGWGFGIGAVNPAQIWKIQWLLKTANYSFAIDNVTFISN